MNIYQCALHIFGWLFLLGVVGSESLDTRKADELLQLLETYKTALTSRYDDNYGSIPYDSPSYDNVPLIWLLKRGAPVYDDESYKRFGFMGSRGKRQGASNAMRAMADLLQVYNQKLMHAIQRAQYFDDEFTEYKNKRQPQFGFHGVRG
ncbi:uncharacterized protein LOC121385462 [Gigantopelta aegis]|uniref:uncharacterized protein LOC121385462 n=1 Tax=Gigantopelta aegis TaxID=1735272 RepID=UPI001B88B96B|nr:uncharacterized protein LOC121385462 [Gigantopelta aegis]XP_041372092.1 uncharacterized protein LOC121385462 [Gigantopelta aegis]